MKVIVLTGLVSVEKAQLSRELAQYFAHEKCVRVIDNIARMAIDTIDSHIVINRIEGDVLSELPQLLQQIQADVTIVALSEQSHPEKIFLTLDAIQEEQVDWEIYALALIDTRTCDCFPNVRDALERFADVSLMIPYQIDDVLNYVNTT